MSYQICSWRTQGVVKTLKYLHSADDLGGTEAPTHPTPTTPLLVWIKHDLQGTHTFPGLRSRKHTEPPEQHDYCTSTCTHALMHNSFFLLLQHSQLEARLGCFCSTAVCACARGGPTLTPVSIEMQVIREQHRKVGGIIRINNSTFYLRGLSGTQGYRTGRTTIKLNNK